MGNNSAFTQFEATIVLLYDKGALTSDVLDALGEQYRGTDIDSGGSRDLQAKDGKYLMEIVIETMCPGWTPVKKDDGEYLHPHQWESDERYDKWCEITDKWGWK